VSRDSAVSIATGCRLDGPRFESRRVWDFPHPSQPVLGPTQPPIKWIPAVPWRQIGRGVGLTTHLDLAPRLKKEYSLPLLPLLVFEACSWVNFTLLDLICTAEDCSCWRPLLDWAVHVRNSAPNHEEVWRGEIIQHIRELIIRWGWVVSFTTRPLCPTTVPTGDEPGSNS
jgi:hypothetical protein